MCLVWTTTCGRIRRALDSGRRFDSSRPALARFSRRAFGTFRLARPFTAGRRGRGRPAFSRRRARVGAGRAGPGGVAGPRRGARTVALLLGRVLRTVRRGLPRRCLGAPVITPIAVVGPTATGKSDLAVALAERFGGEVVNADAMQLYRGMDIGTAKMPVAERRGVPHHLLDVLSVTETASVAAYQRETRVVVERLLAAGRPPILVGGSGLYVQAVLDDLKFPGTDDAVRERFEAELASE